MGVWAQRPDVSVAAVLLVPLLRHAQPPSGNTTATHLPEGQASGPDAKADHRTEQRSVRSLSRRVGDCLARAAAVREGLATVFTTSWLWVTILVCALCNATLVGPYAVAMPFLVGAREGADVRTLAVLYAMFPLGYILGGIWMGRREQLPRRGMLIYTGLIAAGLGLGVLGLPVPLAA